jgi:chromosomal replication initiation ATPase DnaA
MTIERIIKKVAEANGLTVEQLRSSSRKSGIIDVRQVAAYLAFIQIANEPRAAIRVGEAVNRERTTVLWSINRVAERMKICDPFTIRVLWNYYGTLI